MRKLLRPLLLSALAASVAAPASAQGFYIHADGGYQDLTLARDSAKAVFDASGGLAWGGGLGFELGNGLFIDAWARTFSKDGERVFVERPGGPVFGLGHPLTLKLQPIQGTLGFRFRHGSSVRPYFGVGGGVVSVEESSTVGGIGESHNQSKGSFHGLAGVEFGGGSLGFGAEVMYLSIPKSAGLGGVTQVYGESDLGGVSAVGKIRFRFGH